MAYPIRTTYKIFGEDFEDAHDALVDISITEKCFWELRNSGVIKIL